MTEIEDSNAQGTRAAMANGFRSLMPARCFEHPGGTRARAEEPNRCQTEDAVGEQCGHKGCRAIGTIGFREALFCGAACLAPALRAVLHAERQEARQGKAVFGPGSGDRVPVGRILVEQGAITEQQLASALLSQQQAGTGRLGSWLRQQSGLGEVALASALSIQSRCPVFRIGNFDAVEMSTYLPRPFLESCSAIPLRLTGSPQRLALCFEGHVDPALAGAVARMHGIAVDAGLLTATDYWQAARELFDVRLAPAEQREAESIEEALRIIVRFATGTAARSLQVVAVHNCFWVRVLAPDPGRTGWVHLDLLCTLRTALQ